jgi:hypothetical protein
MRLPPSCRTYGRQTNYARVRHRHSMRMIYDQPPRLRQIRLQSNVLAIRLDFLSSIGRSTTAPGPTRSKNPKTYKVHTKFRILFASLTTIVGRDGSVGTATSHGPHGPGIESSGGEIFHIRPERFLDPPSLLHNVYLVSFPGVKSARGVALTTHTDLAPRLKKE